MAVATQWKTRWLGVLLAVPWLLAAGAGTATAAERKVALVVGNAAYTHATPLDNPVNDATLMAETLKGAGFDLVGGKARTDLDRAGLEQAIHDFGKMVRGGAVGLFYYSGHGVQVDGKNYLIPVTANVETRTDIKYQFVDADFVLDELNAAGTAVNVVILDACRNNPFGSRGFRATSGGLAQMTAPRGTLIAYSTGPGKVASDGAGRNSPFTSALARTIGTSGMRIEDVFIKVGQEVEKATGGEQEPWQSNNLRGIFYLAGGAQGTQTAALPVLPEPPASAVDKETVFWQSIQNSDDPALFEAYLRQYPRGTFAAIATARRDALRTHPTSPPRPRQAADATSLSGEDFLRPNPDRRRPPPRRPGEEGMLGQRPPEGRPMGPPPEGGDEGGRRESRAELRQALEQLKNKDFEAAERGFRAFIDAHPDEPMTGMALFGLGETHFVRFNYREAALAFSQSYREHPGGHKADEALLKLAMSLSHMGKNKEACAALNRHATEFPNGDERKTKHITELRQRLGCT
ncbi:MAG: caspase family protein [Alphaproteobacteria bacterium]